MTIDQTSTYLDPLVPRLDEAAARSVLLSLTRGEAALREAHLVDEAARALFPQLPTDRRLCFSVTPTGLLSLWDSREQAAALAAPAESVFTLLLTNEQWDDLLVMARAALYAALAVSKGAPQASQEVA